MTGVIAVAVETGSAKISAKMPDDDPEDYDIPVWAGILPLTTRTGALQEDNRLVEGVEPSGVVLAMQHRMI